jgi:hypothetical protein
MYSRIFPASNEGTLENVEQCQRREAGTEYTSDAALQCLEFKWFNVKTCFSLIRRKKIMYCKD